MKFLRVFITLVILVLCANQGYSQAGISATPAKLYYRIGAGGSLSQKVMISNPNKGDLEVGVSLGDWDYDSLGVNRLPDPGTLKISCADWIRVLPGGYFTLKADERKELDIVLEVPKDADISIPVRTAMLYFSQLNSMDTKTTSGAAIKVTVRMGIKLYHSFNTADEKGLEIINLIDQEKKDKENKAYTQLELRCENTGKIWLEGNVQWELVNTKTGDKLKLAENHYLSLPGDKRIITKVLPNDLKRGQYSATAVINYGNKEELKIAEIEFEY